MTAEPLDHLAVLRHASSDFVAAAAAAGLDAPVPTCPGWDVAALTQHTGTVCAWWRAVAVDGVTDPHDFERPARPEPDALLGWFGEVAEGCAAGLEGADPSALVPTFWGPQPVSTVRRRVAQEVTVHATDAAAAAGRPSRIAPDVALDGLAERFELFATRVAPEGTIHLHCTDVEGEWLLAPDGAGGTKATREHAKGDVAVRGAAADLLLLVWGRIDLDERFEVFGDRGVLERYLAASRV